MKLSDSDKVLIVAFGNVARGDDGLGIRLAEYLLNEHLQNVDIEMDYQLNIELSADLSNYDKVIFVDASISCEEPFEFHKISPVHRFSFTTHSVKPETLLAVYENCFGPSIPETWVLAIRGYDFDLSDSLSENASKNLQEALYFLSNKLLLKRRYEYGAEEKSNINN